jgi:hypothetical protein
MAPVYRWKNKTANFNVGLRLPLMVLFLLSFLPSGKRLFVGCLQASDVRPAENCRFQAYCSTVAVH